MIAETISKLDPKHIPLTPRAAHFHSLHVYLQVARWGALNDSLLVETEWGWRIDKDTFEPIMTDLPVAPDDVLKFVRCKCKRLNS